MANNNVNFSASYSRRPPAQAPAPPKLSLLGDPPISRGGGGGVPRQQQQQQQQSGGGGGGKGHGHGQGQSYGNYGYDAGGADDYRKKAKFEEEYDMMMDEFNEFHDKVEPPGSDSRGAIDYERMERDRGCGGSRWSQNSPGGGRRPQDRQDFNRGGGDDMPVGRHRNPSWTTREDRDYDEPLRMSNQGPGQGQFNQQPNFGASNLNQQFHNPAQNLQGLGLNAMVGQQQQNQQLLNLQSGLLGMMPMNSAQNALSLFQQQQQLAAAAAATAANPMQLLLGNLPAFNSGALGKQILNAAAAAASGGGNPFGPGLGMGNRNMPQPLMGIRTDDSFDKRSFVDRNASSRSRPQQRGRSPVPRNRDAGRVDRKRPGDRYFDHDHKRARSGRDEDKSKVLRTSISSTGSGRSGNRKSEHQGKKKGDKDKGPAKDDKSKDKDKVKGEPGTEKDEVKEETKEGDATEATEEEGADKKSESTDAKEKDKSKEKEKDKSKEKEKEEKRKSRYEEFPASLLVCKVCQKTMNDGSSFESHLTGRAHKALLDIIKQRFLKRADLLMAESKLAEDELGVEMDRQKRAGKSGSSGNKGKNFCKMCDCTYTVNWGAHKAGIHHRVLKEFLHPTCRLCDAQFVHRMDWCNHLLGVAHMKKLAELKAAGKDLFEHESTHQDELFALSIEIGQDEHVSNCVTVRNLDWKVPLKDDLKELLRDDMDIPDGEIMIPDKYDETVAVGEEAIMSTVGYCCKVCKIYMTRESDIEPHLKDKSHFGMYTNFLRKVVRYREDLRRREEAKAKGEPEVLDEKHLKIEILGADDGADHDNDNDDDDAKTEIIGAIKEEGVKKEEIKEEMTESELLKDNENDEEMEEEAETVVNDQKMETETKVDGESQGDNVNGGEIEGEEAVKIVVEEVAEAVKPVGRGKTPPKSDAAATTVTLKPVVQKVAATPTPSRNRAVRGGRGGRGGTPAGARGGGATPGRGGGAPQSAGRGGAGPRGTPRGGLAMRGKPGGAARGGFPRADR